MLAYSVNMTTVIKIWISILYIFIFVGGTYDNLTCTLFYKL